MKNEKIKECVECRFLESEFQNALLCDGDIIKYLLENVEVSFPKERSYSFKIDAEWHLNNVSKARARRVANESGERELFSKEKAFAFHAFSDWGHTSTSWEEILKLGIFGLAERVFEYEKREKNEYYSRLAEIWRAVLAFVKRSASKALECGREELASALFSMTERAPKSFFEALVTILLYYNLHQEIECTPLRTVGRLDLLLFPFYKSSDSVNVKKMMVLFMGDLDAIRFSANLPFALGGSGEDGDSLVNELSYIILDAFAELYSPNVKLHLLTSEKTPDDFLRRAFDIIRNGYNSIVFLSDETVIKSLERIGIEPLDARRYHVVGCYECLGDGEIGSTCAATVNIQKAVEYALFGGFDKLCGEIVGLPRKSDIVDFDEFMSEFERQLAFITECAMRLNDAYETCFAKIHSSPIYTSASKKTLVSGKDVFDGGAKYSNTSLNAIGIATAVDSLCAIKRIVFEERRKSLSEFSETLKNNWDGNEKLRLYAKKKCPKFGTLNSEADSIARHIVDALECAVNGKPNKKGGVYRLGTFSIDWRWKWGEHTLASADGRFLGDTLSQNTGATFGADIRGVSSHLLSVARLGGERTPNGSVIDIDLHSSALAGDEGLDSAIGLIRAYFKEGGFAVHYNVLNSSVLREAKENPEKHPNLQVRKCGWNVRFSSLSEEEQNEFICRAEK